MKSRQLEWVLTPEYAVIKKRLFTALILRLNAEGGARQPRAEPGKPQPGRCALCSARSGTVQVDGRLVTADGGMLSSGRRERGPCCPLAKMHAGHRGNRHDAVWLMLSQRVRLRCNTTCFWADPLVGTLYMHRASKSPKASLKESAHLQPVAVSFVCCCFS